MEKTFSSLVQQSWNQWTLQTADPSSQSPALFILIRDIDAFLEYSKVLQGLLVLCMINVALLTYFRPFP